MDEKLSTKRDIELNSAVSIVSGPHKGLDGKVVAISRKKQAVSYGMSGEKASA